MREEKDLEIQQHLKMQMVVAHTIHCLEIHKDNTSFLNSIFAENLLPFTQ